MAKATIKWALREAKGHPLLWLLIKCFAKRVKDETQIPNQSWREKTVRAFAYSIMDMNKELSDCEDSGPS